tara:strand:- start:2138 stop:6448 length:4311 start_codon:yes stop_codon:yes gene_type:complete
MSDGRVLIELKVVQKGDKLSVVAENTKKVNKQIDENTKKNKKNKRSQEDVIKGQKGVAQTGLSSAKGFSKMNQMLGSGGSSGLVAAYATLAANVFAATAAFNAFRQAAAFEQLTEGFTFMANQSGITMGIVVDRLKEVTGGALSTQEALQGASLAVSAGFNVDQLEELAKVARGASLALGRNLNDAFDRLTRGAIKLEPEILDELGIMVRLDDATEKFAATLGKTRNELTQFERQTAFLNAINEQGIKKYGELADAVDVNPYDQLAAAFGDLTKEFLILINQGLIPIIGFFSESRAGLIGITALFGSTIITTMIPALGQVVQKSKDTAKAQLMLARQTKATTNTQVLNAQKIIFTEGKQTKTIKDMAAAINAKSGIRAQAVKTERNLVAQLARAEKAAAKIAMTGDAEKITAKKARIAQIKREIAAVRVLGAAEATQLTQGLALDRARLTTKLAQITAKNVEIIANVGALKGFKVALKSIALQAKLLFGTGFAARKAAASMNLFTRATLLASHAVKVLGTALLTALPQLAILTVAIALAVFLYKKFTKETELNSTGLDMLGQTTETVAEKFDQLNKSIAAASSGEIRIRQFKQTAGIFKEIAGGINTVLREIEEGDKKLDALGPALLIGDRLKPGQTFDSLTNAERDKLAKEISADDKKRRDIEDRNNRLRVEGLEASKDAIKAILADESTASELATIKLLKFFKVGSEEELLERLKRITGPGGLQFVQKIMSQVEEETSKTSTSITNLSIGINEAEGVFSKFFQTAVKKTPFDDLVKSFSSLKKEMDVIAADPDAGLETLKTLFKESGVQMENFGITTENAATRIPELLKEFRKLQVASRTLQDNIKQLNAEAASLGGFKGVSGEAMEAFLNKQQEVINKQLEFNKLQRDSANEIKDPTIRQNFLDKLNAENAALNAQKKTTDEIAKESLVAQLKVTEKITRANNKTALALENQLKLNQQITNLRAGLGSDLNPRQEFEFKVSAAEAELKAAKATRDVKNNLINAERDLMIARAKADFLSNLISANTANNIIEAVKASASAQTDANDQDIESKKTALELLKLQGIESKNMNVAAVAMRENLGAGFSDFGAKLGIINTQMQPFLQNLRELGPEGEAIAGAQQAFLNLASAVSLFSESVKELTTQFEKTFDKTEEGEFIDRLGLSPEKFAKTIAAMEIMSGVLGSMMANLKAQTAQQVAAIDKQIEAEKRADGSSAASLARIAAMDKKKEAIERKAFERNKKLQIAQTVINTATAAMMAYGQFGFPVGAILAGMILAVGKKQIDIIKNTQFQGGESDPGSVSNISVGKRDNRVDVSRGATGGETAFLRGQSGVGTNANDFIPGGAAGMRRSYAVGGQILVGERGPEVITPTQSGFNVVPNDDLNRGTSNVNFTINAVDAAGVEEVLMAQRGNIIGMIREAANEHGEEFMETVNTGAY